MSNKIANRKVVSDTLLEIARKNKNVLVMTSDSRGSASMLDMQHIYLINS